MPDFTLSMTNAQAQRVAVALGKYWGLTDPPVPPARLGTPRNATPAEVKKYIIETCLKPLVESQELPAIIEEHRPAALQVT